MTGRRFQGPERTGRMAIMRKIRRGLWLGGLAMVVFLGLNYSWTHAALARLVATTDCPPALEQDARHSVATLFGAAQSSPVFLCLQEPVLGLAVSHGTTRFAPFMPSIVVLGPQGQNPDVAAHEYGHAELAQRTSALLRSYRLPVWFDEGLAMQLDHRPDYSETALRGYLADDAITPPALHALDRPAAFFRPGRQGRAHYAFARCVVGRWLEEAREQEMRKVVAGVGWFSRFSVDPFRAHEASCLTGA